MQTLQFAGLILAALVGMEVVSYAIHRWLFHTILWRVHRTHHEKSHHHFELNDLFSLGFAGLAILLIADGSQGDLLASVTLPLGLGITLYGALYFVVHDLYAHRRFRPFRSNNRLLQLVRSAHQRHHQSIDRTGSEPYGLFLFDYITFKQARKKKGKNARLT